MGDLRLSHSDLELLENQERHASLGLSSKHLVVRRGKPFKIRLFLTGKQFSPITDRLIFEAKLGQLCIKFPANFSKSTSLSEWCAEVQPAKLPGSSQCLTVLISTPFHCPIGLYNLQLLIQSQQWKTTYNIGDFILLYNPWCRADSVHMPFGEQREEYVRNDSGVLFMGTPENIVSRPWTFGQYEEGILEICLTILQVSPQHQENRKKDDLSCSDPVYLSRVVCAMVNCQDDMGVLMGNWTGDFSGGVEPSEWTGSAEILKAWARSQFRPVLYGQCWVFAAVLCTIMRALGIPSRVVTNYNSAHDTNANLVIEEFYDESGRKLDQSKDSVWNFHVWVECWMNRPDLGSDFNGWQVLDPTPQERSGGIYCCGPSPVRGVKEKRVDLAYDVPFVYAEVNADVLVSVVKNGRVLSWSVDTERVGSLICTKSLHSDQPLDVTDAYKCPTVVKPGHSASSQGPRQSLAVALKVNTVPGAAGSLSFAVTITNMVFAQRTLRERANAQDKAYHGSPLQSFWETDQRIQLAPHETITIKHWIPHSQYATALVGHNLVNLAVVVEDVVTKERVLASEEFNISTPQISFQIANEGNIVVNGKYLARVIFSNPFPGPASGILTVMGSGLIKGQYQSKVCFWKPGEKMERTVTFTPTMAVTKVLNASLVFKNSSTVLRGFKTLTVKAGSLPRGLHRKLTAENS